MRRRAAMTGVAMNAMTEMPAPLVFTDSAAAKVKTLIDEEGNPDLKLRVFVTGGGCSGFQYGFTFDEVVNEDDTAMQKNGVTLLIDPMSYQYLVGAEIDYSEGLEGAQFVIKNPNATSTCGCGSSFSHDLASIRPTSTGALSGPRCRSSTALRRIDRAQHARAPRAGNRRQVAGSPGQALRARATRTPAPRPASTGTPSAAVVASARGASSPRDRASASPLCAPPPQTSDLRRAPTQCVDDRVGDRRAVSAQRAFAARRPARTTIAAARSQPAQVERDRARCSSAVAARNTGRPRMRLEQCRDRPCRVAAHAPSRSNGSPRCALHHASSSVLPGPVSKPRTVPVAAAGR